MASHSSGNIAEDFCICFSPPQGLDRLSYSLTPPIRCAKRSILFCKTSSGKDHMAEFSSLRHEDILYHQEFQFLQNFLHMMEVWIADHWIFTHDVKSFHLPLFDCLKHLHNGKPGFPRKRGFPSLLKLLCHGFVRDGLVPCVDIGKATHIASTLNIILASEWIDARVY